MFPMTVVDCRGRVIEFLSTLLLALGLSLTLVLAEVIGFLAKMAAIMPCRLLAMLALTLGLTGLIAEVICEART